MLCFCIYVIKIYPRIKRNVMDVFFFSFFVSYFFGWGGGGDRRQLLIKNLWKFIWCDWILTGIFKFDQGPFNFENYSIYFGHISRSNQLRTKRLGFSCCSWQIKLETIWNFMLRALWSFKNAIDKFITFTKIRQNRRR